MLRMKLGNKRGGEQHSTEVAFALLIQQAPGLNLDTLEKFLTMNFRAYCSEEERWLLVT